MSSGLLPCSKLSDPAGSLSIPKSRQILAWRSIPHLMKKAKSGIWRMAPRKVAIPAQEACEVRDQAHDAAWADRALKSKGQSFRETDKEDEEQEVYVPKGASRFGRTRPGASLSPSRIEGCHRVLEAQAPSSSLRLRACACPFSISGISGRTEVYPFLCETFAESHDLPAGEAGYKKAFYLHAECNSCESEGFPLI